LKRRYLGLLLLVSLWMLVVFPPIQGIPEREVLGCSIFTITLGDKVLFGNNEDFYLTGTYIKFVPRIDDDFGYVTLGYDENDHEYDGYAMGGMNDQGLCFDSNGLPEVSLDPKPGQPVAAFHLLEEMLYSYSTVSEVIEWANTSTWYLDMLASQIHVADATGDVVVISAGTDGNVEFTSMEDKHYIVSTNFNVANPENHIPGCYPCWRYDTATDMLDDITTEETLTVEACRNVLDAIHQEGDNPTRYSNVYDLKQKSIHLWFERSYENPFVFDLDEELAKGYQKSMLVDLFEISSNDTTTNTSLPDAISSDSIIISTSAGVILILVVILVRKRSIRS